ncbi:glutathione synthase [Leucogyrophana mollusca]|uniref:Glutathione synthase n=1 Tax=Leucogyrophana mollusca TaxID=85980 RepID=A0ACB8BS27_9AGAM|nr:glutathione synthase [Leucogyrophana mollusca]
MASSFIFSEWPPKLTEPQLESLTLAATTYALSHGLLYLPLPSPPSQAQPPAPTSAIHAPLALFPSPVPRALFDRAQRLQRVYNVLYARVALDEAFLDRVMGAVEGVGRADEFVGTLWRGWRAVRDEGVVQPLQLGLFRSDYLLHTGGAGVGAELELKQVEFNTISSSFGPLSERAAAMHRYLHASTGYFGVSPYLRADNFPPNDTTAGLAQGLAEAHKAYGVPGSQILFVVQPNERNVFDQRWLEYELLEKHAIHVVRQTFAELAESVAIDPTSRALLITPSPSTTPAPSAIEISTIYFRAGYVPTDFPTPADYATRIALERSRAIKCPSIPLQLAGGKKVQEALTKPGVLERFLGGGAESGGYGPEVLEEVRATWMGMWALDEDEGTTTTTTSPAPPEPAGTLKARAHASALDREAWIAMELIVPPAGTGSYLVRAGGGGGVRAEVISELGVFGLALFGGGAGGGKGEGEVREREVGWLMRTKGVESNEGGVAAGFSVLDSVVLVD